MLKIKREVVKLSTITDHMLRFLILILSQNGVTKPSYTLQVINSQNFIETPFFVLLTGIHKTLKLTSSYWLEVEK